MRKIIIFGSGVHSKVVFSEVMQLKKFSVLGFIDDFIEKGRVIETHKRKVFKNLGKIKDLKKFTNVNGIIGVGSNYIRKGIFDEVNTLIKNFKWATVISKNSIINDRVTIGDGSVIVSNSVINTGTIIGNHCLINTSSSIDHDNRFNDFSSTGPGVTTGGNVSVGEMSHLGIGSTTKHQNLAYTCKNIEKTAQNFRKKGYGFLTNYFNSIAFNESRVIFLLSPLNFIIELIEKNND